MPKPHKNTTDYLAKAKKPTVSTEAQAVGAIEKFDAALALIGQQYMAHLGALNAAVARESDPVIAGSFEEARQKIMAVIRLTQEIDRRTTDLLSAIRELPEVNARIADGGAA